MLKQLNWVGHKKVIRVWIGLNPVCAVNKFTKINLIFLNSKCFYKFFFLFHLTFFMSGLKVFFSIDEIVLVINFELVINV